MENYEISLIKVSIDANNNKFWKIKVENNISIREWGRVGSSGSSKTENLSVYAAQRLAEKKIRDGYQEVHLVNTKTNTNNKNNVLLLDKFINELSENNQDVLNVLKYCQESNIHQILDKTTLTFNKNTGLFSTPLGIVTLNSLISAENLLIKIKNDVLSGNQINNKDVEDYLTLIPQKVGLKINALVLFGSEKKIEYQKDILESLKASLDISFNDKNEISNEQEKNPFNVEIKPIEDQEIIELIKKMFLGNIDKSHPSAKLKYSNAFHLNIKSMTNNARFKKGEGKQLWHGTRVGNVLSILKNGMKIISSNTNIVTGRMFGDGLYFSDISTKALNYSLGTWNSVGKGSGNKYYGLICDVFMNKTYQTSTTRISYPVDGYDSTFAKAGVNGLKNNEMIVYSEKQVIPIYLVEFTL